MRTSYEHENLKNFPSSEETEASQASGDLHSVKRAQKTPRRFRDPERAHKDKGRAERGRRPDRENPHAPPCHAPFPIIHPRIFHNSTDSFSSFFFMILFYPTLSVSVSAGG